MKQFTEVMQGEFVDFANRIHKFIVASISESIDPNKDDNSIEAIEVGDMDANRLDYLVKGVKLGVSICSPDDEFNEKAGIMRAIARAEESNYVLYATDYKYINEKVVKALMINKAEEIQKYPDRFIPGYDDTKTRYLKNKEMENLKENFTEVERIIVEKIQEDPKFLDGVQKYLEWFNNQKKGKCSKSGK